MFKNKMQRIGGSLIFGCLKAQRYIASRNAFTVDAETTCLSQILAVPHTSTCKKMEFNSISNIF
jgi:hypothetical protein